MAQIPFIYFILTINSVIVANVFSKKAPDSLTVWVPAVLCASCVIRGMVWYRRRLAPPPPQKVIYDTLRRATLMTIVPSALFVGWTLSLFPYGNDAMRLYLAIFVIMTTMGCALCLMHLPFAALAILAVAIAPCSFVFIASGNQILFWVSINAIIGYMTVISIMMRYFRNFEAMVSSQSDLRRQNTEIARLNEHTRDIETLRGRQRQADLNNIAETFTRSIESVTRALSEVAATSADQSRDVASCSDSSIERLAHVTEAADSAAGGLASVVESTFALFEAIEAIETRTAQATAISTTVDARTTSADQAMGILDVTIGRIDTIATMIRMIAGQIDLIALNATIEAARAGEAGRGFAVVASEIKILAGRTSRATDDIGRNIADIKLASRAANESVASMKAAFLDLRAVGEAVAGAVAIQTNVTDDIRIVVDKAVIGAKTMRQTLKDMTGTAKQTHASALAMLDQCDMLGATTGVLAEEVKNFTGFIRAA